MSELVRGTLLNNIEIVDTAEGGKSIGKYNNAVIFINKGVPGDVADVIITRSKRRYFEADIVKWHTYSPHRTDPICKHFGTCGGCKWQHMTYEKQLFFKQKKVSDALTRIAKVPAESIKSIIPASDTFYYRNKLEFTFTDKRWLEKDEMADNALTPKMLTGLGFHIPEMFSKVLNIDTCYLQAEPSDKIRLAVRQFTLQNNYSYFNLKEQHGFMRNLIIRTSTLGEIMVIVVFYENDSEKIEALLKHLSKGFPEITSLMYVVNPKRNDTINDLEVALYNGKDHLTEKLGDMVFKIGPKSFFQTNSRQAYVLYSKVKEMAALNGHETVYDLYTGTGTLAVFLSPFAHKVVGIEYIEQAVENARENSTLNSRENIVFVAGIMEKILDDNFTELHEKPQVVITDPPRSGMHPKVIEQLLKIAPERIVYVSCNPATQARDIALLTPDYKVTEIQPVDMFPHTEHVENVALLVKV